MRVLAASGKHSCRPVVESKCEQIGASRARRPFRAKCRGDSERLEPQFHTLVAPSSAGRIRSYQTAWRYGAFQRSCQTRDASPGCRCSDISRQVAFSRNHSRGRYQRVLARRRVLDSGVGEERTENSGRKRFRVCGLSPYRGFVRWVFPEAVEGDYPRSSHSMRSRGRSGGGRVETVRSRRRTQQGADVSARPALSTRPRRQKRRRPGSRGGRCALGSVRFNDVHFSDPFLVLFTSSSGSVYDLFDSQMCRKCFRRPATKDIRDGQRINAQ